MSLGVSAAMGSMDSFPSQFLSMGSIPGVDSMQLLTAVVDMTAQGAAMGNEGGSGVAVDTAGGGVGSGVDQQEQGANQDQQ